MKDKKTLTLLIIAIVLALTTVGALAYLFLMPTVKTINFKNMTSDEIIAWQTENKIKDDEIEYLFEFSENIEKDKVISQSIEPNQPIKEKLTITISKGPDPDKKITLIDFNGKTEEEIANWFKENLFTDVTFEYLGSTQIEKNKFLSINIDGTEARRSDMILVTISAGKDSVGLPITIPDFKDFSKANIQAWAKENNITVTFKTEFNETIEEGKVIKQNPEANTQGTTGSKITITLSSGKGIKIENFIGKTKDDLTKWAKENNIKIIFNSYYDSSTKENHIISTDPKANEIIKANTKINAKVSAGLVPIKNYVGKTKSAFVTYVNELNKENNSSAKIQVTYTEEENGNVAEGNIIKMIIGSTTIDKNDTKINNQKPGTNIKVVVSAGQKIQVSNKEKETESNFLKYLEGLGMKAGNKTIKYHDSIASGLIISNKTGTFPKGTIIDYTLSKGSFNPDPNSFVGKQSNDVANIISTSNNEGSGWTYEKTEQYDETKSVGTVLSCTSSNKKLSCIVSKGPKPYEYKPDINSYNNLTVLAAKQKLDTEKKSDSAWKFVAKQPSYNNDVEDKLTFGCNVNYDNKTITCDVSKGKEPYKPTPSDYDNKTEDEARALLAKNDITKAWTINFTNNPSETIEKGKTFGCAISGSSINCKVSTGQTGDLPNGNLGDFRGANYQEALNNIKNALNNAGFTNLVFIPLYGADKDNPNNFNGEIQSIDPALGTKDYPLNGKITIKIYTTEKISE